MDFLINSTFWLQTGPFFILGLLVGSFLNVVGLRLLAEESIAHPPSHCPQCKAPLRPIDNIPVLSYLMLGGKCHHCKQPISIQYPLVELLTGLLFAAVGWQVGISWAALPLLFLMANLVVITITDWRESYIFQINSLSLIPAGLLYQLFDLGQHPMGSLPWTVDATTGTFQLMIPEGFWSALLGIVLAVVFFEGLILLSQKVFGTEGFGHGDTHLMMGVNTFLGWQLGLAALFLGFILQSVLAVPLLVIQWVKHKQYHALFSGGASVLFGLSPLAVNLLNIDNGLKLLLTLVLAGITLVCLVFFLRTIRQTEQFTYMPLGPALILGSLLVYFAGPKLLSVLMHASRF